jgi:CO dehydrogenase nickel-insertion accessory protein CooC1
MTISIAITGKGGTGKTTIVKALWHVLRKKHPDKSILLFDNDLTAELGHSFGLDIRQTIYGIRSGKHEYKTGIPENMTKQEYIEWALEDILQPLDDYTDIIVSWLIGSKDCRCPITKQINDALVKLIKRYDYVIFDCEFDLKYLQQLVEVPINVTLVIARPNEASIHLAKRIEEYSAKYAAGEQLGVVLNKVNKQEIEPLLELLRKYDLTTLGTIPKDDELKNNRITKESKIVENSIEQLYYRLNIPQNEEK